MDDHSGATGQQPEDPRVRFAVDLQRPAIACYLFFFSLFSFRFSCGVRWAFFCCSLLPLSLLPLSPMSVLSVRKCGGRWDSRSLIPRLDRVGWQMRSLDVRLASFSSVP